VALEHLLRNSNQIALADKVAAVIEQRRVAAGFARADGPVGYT
jgi:hypothetical protein